MEKAEEEARIMTAAAKGRGDRKKKEKEKIHGGGEGATTRLKSVHPRAKFIRQLVLSLKKRKKKT